MLQIIFKNWMRRKSVFNTNTAEITVAASTIFRLGMPYQAIRDSKIPVLREIDVKTGWTHRMVGPYHLASHVIYPSLGFRNDILEQVSFAFTEEQRSLIGLRGLHDQFLRQQLGKPASKDHQATRYTFEWGGISSVIDPRTKTANIVMALRPKSPAS